MADLARYVVKLEAETAKYTRELQKANKKLDRFEKNNKKSLASIKKGFAGLKSAVAGYVAVLGIAEIGRFAKATADAAIEMQQFERALKVATGSSAGAQRELDFVRTVADDLGLSLRETAGAYSRLAAASKGTVLQGQAARDIFVGISESARVLGLTAEQTGGALTAIEQIISKGKVSAEELRGQLGERLPGAFQIAARSIGVTTAELDDMLKKGEVLAEDLLPAMAAELHKTFGPEVAAAANDAQAAFNRLNTSLFEMKVAIAESGVLDLLAKLADLTADVAEGIRITFNPTKQEQLNDLQRQINTLEKLKELNRGIDPAADRRINDLQAERLKIMMGILTIQRESAATQKEQAALAAAAIDPITVTATLREAPSFLPEAAKILDKFANEFETEGERTARRLADFDWAQKIFPDRLSGEMEARIRDAIRMEGLEAIEIDVETPAEFSARMSGFFDEWVADAEAATNQMSEFARQAARNIQDSFAEFLFDPFKDGLDGMLQGFVDIIRRMVANIAASEFLGFLGGLGGDFGKFFQLAGRAAGGPVSAGTPYMVGEGGPEVFVPRASGSIVPNGMMGATFNFETNINTSGGGITPQQLVPILEQNNRKQKAEFLDELRRGAYT